MMRNPPSEGGGQIPPNNGAYNPMDGMNEPLDGGDDEFRLFTLCDAVSKLPRPGPDIDPVQLTERTEQTWDSIRAWIAAHPDPDERETAAQQNGENLAAPIHLACKSYDPPADVIDMLIDCSPETVGWTDSFSWLPLHYACANGASVQVIHSLVEAYPESKVSQDKRRRTPLHFFLGGISKDDDDSSSSDTISEIVQILSDSGSAELVDENGMLPLHYACAYGASASVIEVLTSVFPESIAASDDRGRSSLHLAMGNCARSASPAVVALLLNLHELHGAHVRPRDKILNKFDQDGHLPIHLLSAHARSIPPDASAKQEYASACLLSYLSHKPLPTADFLTALQSLPDWLRDLAVVDDHVQTILNEKIAKRFPTSILMLDGYFLLMIVVCFKIAGNEYITHRFARPRPDQSPEIGKLIALYCGALYFLLREVLQMLSLWSLGSFRAWFTDISNWLDIIVIFILIFFTMAMQFPRYIPIDNDTFRSGVAITTGILWCAVISFLKSIFIDFAVFVGGLQYVSRRLAAFMLAISIILILFAQMFQFIYSEPHTEVCEGDPPENPHCKFEYSLLRTYSMMMGEVSMNDYTDSPISAFLFSAFVFLIVILLSNVLIAIVTDSYGVIKNERAAMVFWSNRLDFVAEMDAISHGPWRRRVAELLPFDMILNLQSTRSLHQPLDHEPSDQLDDEEIQTKRKDPFRTGWKALMSLYDDYGLKWNQMEFWCYLVFRVWAAVVLIPLWITIGFASAGWLWPPQIRERLLVQKTMTLTRADLSNQISQQVTDLRNLVIKLREDLKGQIDGDRHEIMAMMTEADKMHHEMMEDMINTKRAMTTFFERYERQCRTQRR